MKLTNSEQPLVSVIMPTYNHAKFIGNAIESVLNQTYQNFELIIIDNYSEDDTEKIVASYENDRIIYLKLRNNGIIAASRNHGIKYSHGDYIAFLDSDDIWLPEKLEKQIKLFQISKETAMVYTRFKTIKEGTISSSIFPKNGRYKSGNIFKSLYLGSFIACSSVMVRKSILNEIGFFDTDPALIAAEDADLWLRIALKHVIRCADICPLLLYRIQLGSISQSYVLILRRSLIIRKRYKKYAGNHLFWISYFLTLPYIFRQKVIPRKNGQKSPRSLSCD